MVMTSFAFTTVVHLTVLLTTIKHTNIFAPPPLTMATKACSFNSTGNHTNCNHHLH